MGFIRTAATEFGMLINVSAFIPEPLPDDLCRQKVNQSVMHILSDREHVAGEQDPNKNNRNIS